jgi:N-methylhydantoinase B
MTTTFDPILVEVVKNEMAAITEEMAIAISRSARSPMVRTGDFAAAICDDRGRIIGQGYAAPQQLAQFMALMAAFRDRIGDAVRPGDVFVANDPYLGSGHMPDVAVIMPVFWRDAVAGVCIAYSHQADIGGRFPGGMSSQCLSSYEEGLRLPIVRLYDGGRRNESLLETISANVRGPEIWLSDVEAKMAGCWRGGQELIALLDRHGRERFDECCAYLNTYSERAMRSAIQSIPDGTYGYQDTFEDDGFGTPGAALPIRVTVTIEGDHATVDFTGTSPQVPSAINMGFSQTQASVYGAFKVLVSPDALMNDGLVRPILVKVPPRCLLNPAFPAAVGGRGPLASRARNVVTLALAQALPGRIPVPSEGADSLHAVGDDVDGHPFVMLDGFFNGWGGRPEKDGIDGVAPMEFGCYGVTPGELLEREYPVVLEGFSYLPDTAGPGRNRGSLSLLRCWRFLEPAHVMLRTTRFTPSPGLAGGMPASPSRNRLIRRDGTVEEITGQMHWHIEVEPGDRLEHVIGGCGGYGPPIERAPHRVLADVVDERLTIEAAEAQYGVVIGRRDGALHVDEERTRAARAEGGTGAQSSSSAAGSGRAALPM